MPQIFYSYSSGAGLLDDALQSGDQFGLHTHWSSQPDSPLNFMHFISSIFSYKDWLIAHIDAIAKSFWNKLCSFKLNPIIYFFAFYFAALKQTIYTNVIKYGTILGKKHSSLFDFLKNWIKYFSNSLRDFRQKKYEKYD